MTPAHPRAAMAPLFSHGFRPFFLAAACWAALAVPLWVLAWTGTLGLPGPLPARAWHGHEMVFGYGAAVLCGFLLTAIPNWTGRMARRGLPLIALALLWTLGRVALLLPVPAGPAAAAELAFPLALLAVIATEIVAGRNWRNLAVVVPVSLFALADGAFWTLALTGGAPDRALVAGIAVLVFLITLIGGRIIPSFTRNWIARQGSARTPAPAGWFDRLAIAAGGLALAGWVAFPEAPATGALALVAGVLHLARLARWRGAGAWPNALLLMLHLSYGVLALGLIALGGAIFGVGIPPDGALHILAPGAVGSMTLAVMMRATAGHTGRPLAAGAVLTLAYLAVLAAGLTRGLAAPGDLPLLIIAAALWSAGFGLFLLRAGPWLVAPNTARRNPNGR